MYTYVIAGAEALGGAMMLLFFATIGAGAGSLTALRSTGWLTAFIAIQLGVHMAVILLGGYVLAGLPMQVRLTPLRPICATNQHVCSVVQHACCLLAHHMVIHQKT